MLALYLHPSTIPGSLDATVFLVGNDKPVDDFVVDLALELVVPIDLYGDVPVGA